MAMTLEGASFTSMLLNSSGISGLIHRARSVQSPGTAMTFSLVARCAATGRLGVAIATASLAVGARCPHALARVGAVTTQSRTDPTIGPRLLHHLGSGTDARTGVEKAVS